MKAGGKKRLEVRSRCIEEGGKRAVVVGGDRNSVRVGFPCESYDGRNGGA